MGSFHFGMWDLCCGPWDLCCSVWDLLVACRTFGCGMGDLLVVVCGIFVVACKSVVTAYVIF